MKRWTRCNLNITLKQVKVNYKFKPKMNRRYLLTSLKIKLEKFQQPPKMKNEKKKKMQGKMVFISKVKPYLGKILFFHRL